MNRLRFLTVVIGIVSIIISSIALWMANTFGKFENIHFEQILWHIMESPFDGIDSNYIRRGSRYFLLMTCICFIWFFIVNYQRYAIGVIRALTLVVKDRMRKSITLLKECIPETVNNTLQKILFCICIAYFLGIIVFIDHKLHIYEYIVIEINGLFNNTNTDEIQAHYSIPSRKDISFTRKESIVLILAESMENSFNDPFLERQFMPNMEKLRAASKHNDNYINVYGSGWTIGSVTGWFFGLPLKLPHGIDKNQYISKKGFLPGAESIFDILQENGYELVFLLGSDSRFSGNDILFSDHGGFAILDKKYFLKQGWSLEKYGGTGWGFNDAFVLARAWEEYQKLKASGKPFVLFIETIDTHSPDGFCPSERRKYSDIRDAIVELDRNLADFSNKIWDEDVVYIVLGDHFFMGYPEFMSHLKERRIFNLFHGNLPPVSEKKRDEYVSALDMAPTILQSAGARWKNDQFGLGISLFSDQSTLLEQYGPQKFDEILNSWSPFYSTLYEKKADE